MFLSHEFQWLFIPLTFPLIPQGYFLKREASDWLLDCHERAQMLMFHYSCCSIASSLIIQFYSHINLHYIIYGQIPANQNFSNSYYCIKNEWVYMPWVNFDVKYEKSNWRKKYMRPCLRRKRKTIVGRKKHGFGEGRGRTEKNGVRIGGERHKAGAAGQRMTRKQDKEGS